MTEPTKPNFARQAKTITKDYEQSIFSGVMDLTEIIEKALSEAWEKGKKAGEIERGDHL